MLYIILTSRNYNFDKVDKEEQGRRQVKRDVKHMSDVGSMTF